jgi:hypothetical protein
MIQFEVMHPITDDMSLLDMSLDQSKVDREIVCTTFVIITHILQQATKYMVVSLLPEAVPPQVAIAFPPLTANESADNKSFSVRQPIVF